MRIFILLTLFSCAFAVDEMPSKAVTYGLSGGRLGNNLISYLQGKWIAEKCALPLLYKPFPHADQFAFHETEKYTYIDWKDKYPLQYVLRDLNPVKMAFPGTLFVVPYLRYDRTDWVRAINPTFYPWDTQEFRQFARELLKPRFDLNLITPPKETLNVLLHVRTGGGFDREDMMLRFFIKFPPIEFYAEALERISEHFGHPQIYAFIMTDDQEPLNLLASLGEKLGNRGNILFDCREEGGPDVNILDDFFSVPAFDCLVRGDSTFTIVASLLADLKMVIFPKSAHLEDKKTVIDELEIVCN